jgi:4'-phosphopantetheinyl transferase
MTADEFVRYRKFQFREDRHLFLVTRALIRSVLSQYAQAAPSDWRFTVSEYGKPRVCSPAVSPTLHFNLANTRGLVACAVAVALEQVGVDAEQIDREVESVRLADRFFSPSEARAIRAMPADLQGQLFFAHWTLKESYIKARGLGLALPLDGFSFVLGNSIDIVFGNHLVDDARRWRFALLDMPPRHLIAVGANTGGESLSLRASEFTQFE